MRITLVGLGMGNADTLTAEAAAALSGADAVVGAARLLDGLTGFAAEKVPLAVPEKVAAWIERNPDRESVCVALSGDVGFYSGAKKLLRLLEPHKPRLICGVSSPQYFAARLGRPWQDFHLVSGHGAPCDVLAEVLNHRETFFLAGGDFTPARIAGELCAHGLDGATLTVGENLGSPDEAISSGTAGEMREREFSPLCVVLVDNARTFARAPGPGGLADAEFLRGDAPMTKREVRAAALAMLRPRPDDVLYDVGAGTGSVAVELALQARRGRVYAVERDAAACGLLAENREKFGVHNLVVVPGVAPEALADLPSPDAAFVGGSGGNLRDILGALLDKNAELRVVVAAVTLETLSVAVSAMEELGLDDAEVCQIAASRAVVRGGYHMLKAQNPVFLIGGGLS